ncbi:hypothetical protein [Nocardia africana]
MPEPIMKALATITEPDAEVGDFGGFTAVLSTPALDRDGDRLHRDEWVEPLPDKITLDVDHMMTAEGTIGSARPYFDDDGRLMIDARFASTDRAQQVRTLIKEGHLDSVSVAFLSAKSEKDGRPRRELLNAGVVGIPSNREARILSAKALDALENYSGDDGKKPLDPIANIKAGLDHITATHAKAGARNSQADSKMIQAIHDASSLLGADCVESAPDAVDGAAEGANKAVSQTFVVGKSLSGSVEDLRDRVTDALQDLAGEGSWVWVRATFLDLNGTSGTIVYDLGEETYSRTFTDENGSITLGTTIECVTIVNAIKPADPQVDDDPSDAVEGAADEHDPDEMKSVTTTPAGGSSNLPALNADGTAISPEDIEAFKHALDVLTKSSGTASPEPSEPADPPAAPTGPAAGEAADEDEEAPEIRARNLRLRMLAFDAERAPIQ